MHAIGRLADHRGCQAPSMGRETLFTFGLTLERTSFCRRADHGER